MFSEIINLTEPLDKNPPLSLSTREEVFARIGFTLPADYIEFMRDFNGGEVLVGEQNYLEIWRIEELIPKNEKYQIDKYANGYFVFASNAGGTAYAFSKKDSSIVSFEFVGMLISDEPTVLGHSFLDFLRYLWNN